MKRKKNLSFFVGILFKSYIERKKNRIFYTNHRINEHAHPRLKIEPLSKKYF